MLETPEPWAPSGEGLGTDGPATSRAWLVEVDMLPGPKVDMLRAPGVDMFPGPALPIMAAGALTDAIPLLPAAAIGFPAMVLDGAGTQLADWAQVDMTPLPEDDVADMIPLSGVEAVVKIPLPGVCDKADASILLLGVVL